MEDVNQNDYSTIVDAEAFSQSDPKDTLSSQSFLQQRPII